MTYHELERATDRLIRKLGIATIVHATGEPGVAAEYGVKVVKLQTALRNAASLAASADRKRDLALLYDRMEVLRRIIMQHFRLSHSELASLGH